MAGPSTRQSLKRKLSSSVADTVAVKPKRATAAAASRSLPGDEPGQGELASSSASFSSKPGPKGEEPAYATTHSDDEVEEYQIEDDMSIGDYEDEDLSDDAKSVITLSSESPTPEEDDDSLPERPWKEFSREMRRQWEIMYSSVAAHAVTGDWDKAEDYQREKDIEMLRYMEDFPLKNWVISRDEAVDAYYRLLERTRWRSLGIRIYKPERFPDFSTRMNNPLRPVAQQSMRSGQSGPPQGPPLTFQQMAAQIQHPGQAPPQHHGFHHTLPQHPPPGGVLPSQPYAQPMYAPQHPHGLGRPVGVPQPMAYGTPSFGYPGQPMPPPGAYATDAGLKPRRGRDKKETPVVSTPPPPPPTPPYKVRQKPSETRKPVNPKPTRRNGRNVRRQAEADEFPWTRNFKYAEAKAVASWDDTIYDPETIKGMEGTRTRNVPVIDRIDAKLQETQRQARAAKKEREKKGDNSSDVEGEKKERKKRGGQPKGETGGDPYHSGAYAFASAEDEEFSKSLGFASPDEAIDAGDNGKADMDQLGKIKICWNPGKKGMTENLEQAQFSVRDNVLTRKQLDETPILTRRAAECIVDFCPDLLWRGMLLRITSEGGYGNKDVRDRFCYNGCYCDKATITKRISAALGQKQVQPKSKGYQDGELEWYEQNVKDFTHYIEYFGKRTSHRNMLKIQIAGEKRRALAKERSGSVQAPADESSDDGEGASKGAKKKGVERSEVVHDSDTADVDGKESGDESDDSNAVSLQDSDILDKMEED